jgi:hypothetical protein
MLRFMQICRYALSFAPTPGIEIELLNCGIGNKWRGRATMQTLAAKPPGGDPLPDPFADADEPDDDDEPTLPTPTDVPPPTPTDVPVPEPWDIPPPDPKDRRPKSIP